MMVTVLTVDATTNVPIPSVNITFITAPGIKGAGETNQYGTLILGQFLSGQVISPTKGLKAQRSTAENVTILVSITSMF